ncbi:MAG: bifunctional 3-(3-hydroxy-phenyl)propionate/3-hydroxycinnamic acid hydroxylase [Actinobacteria bacterium]|jgi:3-(3-hydroxy-phenyl)propionate hydroxylase|nr:bifunctional 3-(3-hydroxy-phenyl)propionate/3-hydroxycinnamic acid hydroxylase [Actinomycetota bacterium]
MSVGTFDADVAIVGYGPSGVVAASMLGKAGVPTVVLERDVDLYSRARAVTVNDWTLRIFQELGIAERVKADMDEMPAVSWKTYEGRLVFRLVQKPDVLGHPTAMMIYQPEMEAVIRENASGYGSLNVRFGHTFTGLEQDEHGVTLRATDPEGAPYTLRVRYVIGADGGSSPAREALGATMVGTTRPRRWLVIDGEVLRPWPGCDELTFWSDPVRPVVDIPLAKGNHRWEIPLGPGESDDDYASEDAVWARLRALGVTTDQVRIKGYAFYSHHLRHLEGWRRDRVVLIGDAAHLMPPWAGQGMQSGIRDAHNIAWKLAVICAGHAGPDLLDTVESERWPHVSLLTEMSVRLGMFIEADNRAVVAVRNTVAPWARHLPFWNRILQPSNATNRFETGWLTGTPGRRNALGRMIPQPTVFDRQGRQHLLDDLVGSGFVVFGLDCDPRSRMTAAQVRDWERLGASFRTVRRSFTTTDEADDVIDARGVLVDWLERHRTKVVVVRPDRFVAATDLTGLDVPSDRGNLGPTRRSDGSPGRTAPTASTTH